jgi:Papain family cysteine protease
MQRKESIVTKLLTSTLLLSLGFAFGISACSSSAATGTPDSKTPVSPPAGKDNFAECFKQCEADDDTKNYDYCSGPAKKTVNGCDVICGKVDEKGLYPGKCRADGSPQKGAPELDGEEVCDGALTAEGDWVTVNCADQFADEAAASIRTQGAATELRTLAVPTGIPAAVDHRARFGRNNRPHDQMQVGSCATFALVSAMEATLSSRGVRQRLNEQSLWLQLCSSSVQRGFKVAQESGVSTSAKSMDAWPYDGSNPSGKAKTCENRKAPDPTEQGAVAGLTDFKVQDYTRMVFTQDANGAKDLEPLYRAIAAGSDVYAGFNFAKPEWDKGRDDGKIDVGPNGVKGNAGHAVLVVGYKVIDGKNFFIVRNSWGAWGDNGYGYISEDTVSRFLMMAYTITVACTDCVEPKNCPDGSSVDPVSKECRKLCVSNMKFADANGVCSDICDPGEVKNPDGICVPPCDVIQKPNGAYGETQVCTAEGCDYQLPNGAFGCTQEICKFSCKPGACGLGLGGADASGDNSKQFPTCLPGTTK